MNGTSYSNINDYQRCPKKYYYRNVLDLQPKKRAVALFDGINGHDFLKVFFLSLQGQLEQDASQAWEDVLIAANALLAEKKEITFEDELADAQTQIENILAIIERYCNQYAEEWEILHVEEEFIAMLDSGEVLTFTPDLVVRDRAGYVWIVDHKTTSRMPQGGIPFGDTQALLYYAGVSALYPETKGFIFNRLRKKLPMQPRLTKTGALRVANVARLDTTYEILRDFIKAEAPQLMADPVHQRKLGELRDDSGRFFWTEQVYVNADTVASILDDVSDTLVMMAASRESGSYPRFLREDNGYNSCSKCPMQRLCHGEQVGWDLDTIIEESYEPREAKNPYEREADDGQN